MSTEADKRAHRLAITSGDPFPPHRVPHSDHLAPRAHRVRLAIDDRLVVQREGRAIVVRVVGLRGDVDVGWEFEVPYLLVPVSILSERRG